METSTIYEEQILKDIQGLSPESQRRLARIIHFVKNEIIDLHPDEKKLTEEFLSVCGTWEDERSAEKQIRHIYSARKSRGETGGTL